jgi:hypothetical protein
MYLSRARLSNLTPVVQISDCLPVFIAVINDEEIIACLAPTVGQGGLSPRRAVNGSRS